MNKLTCEIGDVFGDWTVIDNNVPSSNGHTRVKCKCKCGREQIISLTSLKNGKTKHCKTCSARNNTIQLNIGDTYKDWTVINGPIYKNQTAYYTVRCRCGNEIDLLPSAIVNPKAYFRCNKCARKINQEIRMKKNGKIGDLQLQQYTHIKSRANKRELDFNVSMEYLWNLYIAQDKKCAITGDKIESIKDASLDRIDSTIGYIEGNVQWVTKQANLSKHVMTMPELIKFCKKVLNHANQQPNSSLTTQEGSETNSWNLDLKEEYQKCMNDFEYFKNNYIKVKEYNTNTSAEYPENTSG